MAAVLAVTAVAALTAAAPASAATTSFTLDMIGGQGRVVLGKSPGSPLVLSTPSTIRGAVDDQAGAITGGSLSTPPIQFTQQITTPVVADVDITATFSDTTPNTGTGQVDGLGNVSFSTSLNLDLHVDVGGGLLTGDCTSAPITLNLVSTAPYDPELGEVTLTDPAFAIPAAVESATCPGLIVGPINEQLSAPNNAITLGLVGSLPLPPPPGEPSTTTLTSNATSTPLGHPATFTATVSPEAATGTVTFLSGTTSIGIASVAAGAASLTTSSLPVGSHAVTARYSGDTDHRPSTSAPVDHTVTATPNLAGDLPSRLVVGAAPTEFTTTITNPIAGEAQSGLRIDLRLGRVGTATTLGPAHLTLEHRVDGAWAPVTLARRTTPAPADPTGTVAGSYGGIDGFALAPGETRVATFRLAAASNAPQGHMAVEFTVKAVAPGGAVVTTFSTTTASIALVESERRPTTAAITGGAGTEIRQGFALDLTAAVTRSGATPLPGFAGGQAELLIDGRPVSELPGPSPAPNARVTVAGTGSINIGLLAYQTQELTPGLHRAAVRFLGDALHRPSLSAEVTFTVHAQGDPAYACTFSLAVFTLPIGGRVDIHGDLPAAAPAGTDLAPGRFEVIVTLEDNPSSGWSPSAIADVFNSVAPDQRSANLLFGAAGSVGSFASLVGGVPAAAPGPREATLSFVSPTLSIPIDGAPGDVIDVDLEELGFVVSAGGVTIGITCTPVDEAASLGSVMVAGTSLSASSVGPVEEGSAVTLSASVFPSSSQGMVEFFDGATSIGFAPVSAGTAVLPTTGLPQGRRSVSARYLGDLVNAPSTSEPVEVTVRDAILCKNQTGTESGSTVRATYLSLLGRCAEPSGFAFWRGRLDAGLSAEVFAGQIANTLEAHGRSVDDGYRLVLGRNADSAGRAFWAQRLNGGQRYDLLLGDLAASPEFWAASGSTNSGFVTRLYDRLLHRAPDASGLAYWVGRLNAGASRASVAASFVRLPEPSGQIVVDAYEAILDRAPSGAEKAPAVAAFQGSGHRWKVYAGLIGTTEFHDRAQGHPNS